MYMQESVSLLPLLHDYLYVMVLIKPMTKQDVLNTGCHVDSDSICARYCRCFCLLRDELLMCVVETVARDCMSRSASRAGLGVSIMTAGCATSHTSVFVGCGRCPSRKSGCRGTL